MKSHLVILLFAIVATSVIGSRAQWDRGVYNYDSKGYYMYLPAFFVQHDLKHVYLSDFDAARNIQNKYPLGVAIMAAPFFLAAHSFVNLTHSFPADGYSLPYRLGGEVCTLFYVIAGLMLLRLVLLLHFTDSVTAIALLCIAFGTNLYTYAILIPCMSHPFSFFLFASFLYCVDRLQVKPHHKHFYLLAITLGLSTIVRPTNGILLMTTLPLFLSNAPRAWANVNKHTLAVALVLLFAIVFVQFTYWHYTSGHWLHYSYGRETFDFRQPKIIQGLFSYRKGWWVYTPMAAVCIAGVYPMWQRDKRQTLAIVVFTLLGIYITFSWKNWWYGGGFGARPMIEFFAILIVPLCYLIQSVSAKGHLATIALLSVLMLFITLNIFQSHQFASGVIHPDRMSRAYYWKVFGKTHIDPASYEQYLMSEKEYWRVNAGLNQ